MSTTRYIPKGSDFGFMAGCQACAPPGVRAGSLPCVQGPDPGVKVGAMADYVAGPDTVWDRLFLNLQGGRLDPVHLYDVPEAAPSGVDPGRWAGFLDGVTYGGGRTGVIVGLVGVVTGLGLGMIIGRGKGAAHHHRSHRGSGVTENIIVR